MGPSGVNLSSERRDGLSIYRILEQDQVVTISPLGGIFAKVHVLVQSDYRQVSVMTSLGKEIFDSRVLWPRSTSDRPRLSRFVFRDRRSRRFPVPSGCLDEILLVGRRRGVAISCITRQFSAAMAPSWSDSFVAAF